jgi:NitT/TauT family transport system ATP-binding protein
MMRDIMATSASDPAPSADRVSSRPGGIALELACVQRSFDRVPVLRDIDLLVPGGQFLALLGPSGCGKSTLLRLVAGLDRADDGTVRVGGRRLQGPARGRIPAARSIAFVFQSAHLLPWRTLLRNVELPLELRGVARAARRDKAMHLIEQVGLADAAHRYPGELSGGMQMRASLARALVTDPELLLLDEPFAALDELTRQRLDGQLHALWRQRRITVLFVTHAISEAVFLAQRAIMFSARPARIVADRRIDLPEDRTPAVRNTAAFGALVRQLQEDLAAAEDGA